MTSPAADPSTSPELATVRARTLTHAILGHYGFTADDIAAAELVHPGRVCDEEACWTEDGESIHGTAHTELHLTAGVVIDVVMPWLDDILTTPTTPTSSTASTALTAPTAPGTSAGPDTPVPAGAAVGS